MSASRKSLGAAFAIALAAGTVSVVAPTASAATDGSNVVINEVYGGGGNSGAKFTHDFVELYNPTDAPIDLTGWTVTQRSTSDTGNGSATLSGSIPAKGYYLIQGAKGNGGTEPLPTPDAIGKGLTFGGSGAIARIIDSNSNVVDLVGWGGAKPSEGSPAGKTKNSESVQRKEVGVDSDNNANDFIVAEPTPQNSGNAGETPVDPTPEDPTDPTPQPEQPQPGEITPIAEIQGTSAKSPLEGKTVTTEGVVTAVYDEGGKNGFFLQTAGTGTAKNPGDASDGIFVYMGGNQNFPKTGDSVQVTGSVSEYYSQTQITVSSLSTLDEALEPPKAIEIDALPAGDEAREPYEGMLVRPKSYTVTNNYTLNTHGDLGLAPGDKAFRNPTDVIVPDKAEVAEMNAQQAAEVVYLDDGRTRDYFRKDKNTPLPYIVTSDGGVKSIRTGDQVTFQTDVVVDYSFDQWRFQPLQPITGKNTAEELPITWEDSRATSYNVPDTVEGDNTIGFFNVLNYFTSLGKDESGCKSYNDMNGDPVATNRCKVRGAYSPEAFQNQQAKIVTAINKLDAHVLGLSEIENGARVTGDVAQRDNALANLVKELNEAAGENKWDYVKSPSELGTAEDFIRVGFIYQPAQVEPVGESRIFDDPAFTRMARQPLAQEFNTVNRDDDENFVAVVNHFKSKGSVVNGDKATGDGQGNNANVRVAQAQALLDHMDKQDDWQELPTFLVGDFNAYTMENALNTLRGNGYTLVHHEKDFPQESYQFNGQLGSLDHVFANEAAMTLVQDSAVWNINGDESVAFEYSRRNYNAQDFFGDGDDPYYGYGNPFRSSDHDPVKVGFGTKLAEKDADKFAPEASEAVTVTQGDALPDAKTTVKDADQLPEDTKFEWTKPADTNTVGDDQEGEITVTYPDESVDHVKVVVNVKPKAEEEKPRYIVKAEINDAGELVVTYDNGDTENLGEVKGADGQDGEDGERGPKGDKGDTGAAGKDGADGKNGVDGKDGKQGPKGDKGDTGAAGKDG
ncbi:MULTISPECIES: ExeM/NucH family extracellular endonuclease, partial [Corynebacterium]